MIEAENAISWAKIELDKDKIGFVPAKIATYQDSNEVSLICQRPFRKSLFGKFSSKPFPNNTRVNLSFQEKNTFELWSADIESFLGFRNNLDEYKLKNLKLESSCSERQNERFITRVPVKLKILTNSKKIFRFSGCELSKTGIGFWLPDNLKDKIKAGEIYQVIFDSIRAEPFHLLAECVRTSQKEIFSDGFTLGFKFLYSGSQEDSLEQIAKLRIEQLLEARGKVKFDINSINYSELDRENQNKKHYLEEFWEGQFVEF